MKENAVTKPVRDTFLLSLSTALATAIQALATFGLTKLIPTEDFGAWREFVLAAGSRAFSTQVRRRTPSTLVFTKVGKRAA